MLRLLKSTGIRDTTNQIAKIVYNLDAFLARDVGQLAPDLSLEAFILKLDFHFENWKQQADKRRIRRTIS